MPDVGFPMLFPPGVGAGGINAAALDAYWLALSPTLYLKFNELSGNCVSYGSDNIAGTVSGCTQGQPGQLGIAYSYDGVDDKIAWANANVANTKALTSQRWMFLIKATNLGEGSRGTFFMWGDGTVPDHALLLNTNNRLEVDMASTTTLFTTLTNDNQVDFLGQWALVFMDFDNVTTRKPRLWRATATSVPMALTLAANPALTGTLGTPSGTLNLGNSHSTLTTFAGSMNRVGVAAGLWTDADMLQQKRWVFGG